MQVPTEYKIPARVLCDKELSSGAKILYAVLNAGFCEATNEELADHFKASLWVVEQWLKELGDHGYIVIDMPQKQRKIRLIK